MFIYRSYINIKNSSNLCLSCPNCFLAKISLKLNRSGSCLIYHHLPAIFFHINLLDLSPYNFRYEIPRFRARRSKNYEAYTVYMLNNFYEVVAEILELQ